LLYERASELSLREDEANRLAEHLVVSRKLLNEWPADQRVRIARELATDRYRIGWSPVDPNTSAFRPQLGSMQGQILAWEPVPARFTPGEASRVLGVEAAVWTEFIESERYLEFMTFPRLLALAEVAWRTKGPRDDKEFEQRLAPHLDALRARGINARRGEWDAYEYITN